MFTALGSLSCVSLLLTLTVYCVLLPELLNFQAGIFFDISTTYFCQHNWSFHFILPSLILGPADSLQLGLHAAGHSVHPCSVQLQLHPSHLCCGELLNNNNNRQVVLIKTILAWILWLLCYHLHVPVDQRPMCGPLHYSPAPRPGCSVYTGA